jgi:3-oxoisoapionate decarboxylase
VTRRSFLASTSLATSSAIASGSAMLAATTGKPMPLGINTYCLRSLRWNDRKLLDYTASLKMDAIFLQDSLDPQAMDPKHWEEVRRWASELNLHLQTGAGGVLPKTPDALPASAELIRKHLVRAKALGSPLMRAVIASDRASLPPGPVEQHMETMVRLLKEVRQQVVDSGVKIAIEVHKDLQAWELKQVLDAAGKDFVGVYMDTGNPVFVCEHPLTTLETLAPHVLTLHLRDSVLYETPRGVAVQWVPLGEGTVDFKQIMQTAQERCPNVHVFVKPITGRPPQVLPYLEESYWQTFPKARASEFARFLALVKKGKPYEGHVVIEDLQNRPIPPHFLAAVQFQQQEHMERSVEYAKKTLDLGQRWRSS